MSKIYLEKTAETGNKVFWEAFLEGSEVTYRWGVVGGKVQENSVFYTEGKNIGKRNETSAEEQALFEMERKARKKMEGNYSLIKGKLTTTSKTAVASDVSIPKPMLAKTFDDQQKFVKSWKKILGSPKLDGNRCLINLETGKMYSRSRKEIISIPELGSIISKACENLKKRGIIWVDGELYSSKITFNEIQSIIRKSTTVDSKATEIKFYLFDYISSESYTERYNNMIQIDKSISDRIEIVKTYSFAFDEIQEYHDHFVQKGYEGIMLRYADGPYESKRSKYLIKYKNFFDEEFKIIGFQHEKNNPDKLGAVILVTKEGKEFTARPAMTEEEREKMWNNQDKYIGLKATVKFQEKDLKTQIPRFGILKGIRAKGDI